MLRRVRVGRCGLDLRGRGRRKGGERGAVAEERDVCGEEGLGDFWPDGGEDGFVQDERFCCVARGGVVDLLNQNHVRIDLSSIRDRACEVAPQIAYVPGFYDPE